MGTRGVPLTPAQRSLRARIAANARWSRTDGRTGVAPARRGFELRFERLVVDPDGKLDPKSAEYAAARDAIPAAELERRIGNAMSAHMQQLAFRRSRAATGVGESKGRTRPNPDNASKSAHPAA